MSLSKDDLVKVLADKWWDEDLQDLAEHEKTGKLLFLFIFAFHKLCVKVDGKSLRRSEWRALDINGNNIVSLAETGKWVQDYLKSFYADKDRAALGVSADDCLLLWKAFRPCFIRAFMDAADYGPAKKGEIKQKGTDKPYAWGNTTTDGDDYVQWPEFRLFVTYLCIYAAIFEAFVNIDGSGKGVDGTDDRKINLDEWKKNLSLLKGHPLDSLSATVSHSDPEKTFQAMDADGKGCVLMSEFSEYIEDFEYDLGTRWGKLLNAGEKVKATSAAAAISAET